MARNVELAGAGDTIVAPATAPVAAAIAIVRVSGPRALAVGAVLAGRALDGWRPGQLRRVMLQHGGRPLDDALVVCWRGPRSYTGEDVVEFHVHGSPAVVAAVMEACVAAGARRAAPGEYTRRAYLNGRIDLAQAEAVAQLTAAQTDAARRIALGALAGGVAELLAGLRGALVQLTAEMEAAVDYPEEVPPGEWTTRLAAAAAEVARLLQGQERGRLLSRGARVVLAGIPNAGKSSLFNALVRRERAIVSPHPGTTRDTVEATVEIAGVPLTLVDTAGLRATHDEIEAMGIGRTREAIEAAAMVLFLADPTAPGDDQRREYDAIRTRRHVVVAGKLDLSPAAATEVAAMLALEAAPVAVNLRAVSGVEAVERALLEALGAGEAAPGEELLLASDRQRAALAACREALESARGALHVGVELALADMQLALSHLDAITGRQGLDEDILDALFATFCLGK
jgi:tRNA modification GTPase